MEKFLLITGSVWALLAFLFVFALAAASRKRVVSEREAMETKRAQEPVREVSPARPRTTRPVRVANAAHA